LLPTNDWHFVIFGFLARAEAERLLLGKEVSPPVTAESMAEAREKWKSVREPLVQAEGFARQGQWKESRDAYVQALQHPSFDWGAVEEASPMRCLSLHMGIAFVRAGDPTNHARLSRLLLAQRPENPTTPRAERDATARANRYAHACFLNAGGPSPELRQGALELARFAVANQRKRKDHHPGWTCLAGGMAECQAGEPERALELLQEAEKDTNPLVKGIAMAYRAMVLRKLNRTPEAAQVLHEAEHLLSSSPDFDASLYWWDAEQYQLALEEARQLIRR
jgi:tetratricopeptide (TPR) repeat protein